MGSASLRRFALRSRLLSDVTTSEKASGQTVTLTGQSLKIGDISHLYSTVLRGESIGGHSSLSLGGALRVTLGSNFGWLKTFQGIRGKMTQSLRDAQLATSRDPTLKLLQSMIRSISP